MEGKGRKNFCTYVRTYVRTFPFSHVGTLRRRQKCGRTWLIASAHSDAERPPGCVCIAGCHGRPTPSTEQLPSGRVSDIPSAVTGKCHSPRPGAPPLCRRWPSPPHQPQSLYSHHPPGSGPCRVSISVSSCMALRPRPRPPAPLSVDRLVRPQGSRAFPSPRYGVSSGWAPALLHAHDEIWRYPPARPGSARSRFSSGAFCLGPSSSRSTCDRHGQESEVGWPRPAQWFQSAQAMGWGQKGQAHRPVPRAHPCCARVRMRSAHAV